jgi:hypothetical protein
MIKARNITFEGAFVYGSLPVYHPPVVAAFDNYRLTGSLPQGAHGDADSCVSGAGADGDEHDGTPHGNTFALANGHSGAHGDAGIYTGL